MYQYHHAPSFLHFFLFTWLILFICSSKRCGNANEHSTIIDVLFTFMNIYRGVTDGWGQTGGGALCRRMCASVFWIIHHMSIFFVWVASFGLRKWWNQSKLRFFFSWQKINFAFSIEPQKGPINCPYYLCKDQETQALTICLTKKKHWLLHRCISIIFFIIRFNNRIMKDSVIKK